jgi:hypothetical protein
VPSSSGGATQARIDGDGTGGAAVRLASAAVKGCSHCGGGNGEGKGGGEGEGEGEGGGVESRVVSPVPLRRHRLAEPLRQHHLGAATDRAARVLAEAAVHCVRDPAAWMVKGGGTSVVAAP